MKYTTEEIDAMLYALNDAIDELDLTLAIIDECEQRDAYIEQLKELDKIVNLLNNLKL
jgi:exonuclease VII small subunit